MRQCGGAVLQQGPLQHKDPPKPCTSLYMGALLHVLQVHKVSRCQDQGAGTKQQCSAAGVHQGYADLC